jgi:hypothetical protein
MRPPASPSCRLYPPACKPYGLEAEPEAIGAYPPACKPPAYKPTGWKRPRREARIKRGYELYSKGLISLFLFSLRLDFNLAVRHARLWLTVL